MLKKIIKLSIFALLFYTAFHAIDVVTAGVTLPEKVDLTDITDVSIGGKNGVVTSGDPIYAINDIGFNILTTLKLVLQGLLVIYIVYT